MAGDHQKILRSITPRFTHTCPHCGQPVHCDVEAGKSTCWCFGVQVKEQEHGDVCLCRSCLTQERQTP